MEFVMAGFVVYSCASERKDRLLDLVYKRDVFKFFRIGELKLMLSLS